MLSTIEYQALLWLVSVIYHRVSNPTMGIILLFTTEIQTLHWSVSVIYYRVLNPAMVSICYLLQNIQPYYDDQYLLFNTEYQTLL